MPHYFDTPEGAPHAERTVRVEALGRALTFVTDSGVFSRGGLDFGSRLMLEHIDEPPGRGLDLGCGWGPVGAFLAAAQPQSNWLLCDVNTRAAALAQRNLEQNGIPNARAVASDGVPQGETFDVIALNPPVRAGKAVVHRLFEEAYAALAPGGALYVVLQVKQGAPSAKKKLEELFGRVDTRARSAGYHVLCARRVFASSGHSI